MKIFLPVFLALLWMVSCSPSRNSSTQNPSAVVEPPPPPEPLLRNAMDSFSYALGLSMANFYREQGITGIEKHLIARALEDAENDSALLDEEQINNAVMSYLGMVRAEKAAKNKQASQAFLDSNKTQEGVVALPSGLQYKILREGSGPRPGLSDRVRVHYEGSLLNGKIFDSSIERGEPIELSLDRVISGWTEALQLMPVGSRWKLFIPSELGYGDNGAGTDIKPGDLLIFDVELLEILR